MRQRRRFDINAPAKGPEPVQIQYVEVTSEEVRGDQTKLIKKFMKKCQKEEIFKEYFERRYYKSKSVKRREKHRRAVYEKQKEEKNQES